MKWADCFLRRFLGLGLGFPGVSFHRPERVCRGPRGVPHPVAIADFFVYAELGGRLADVVEDGGRVGDGLGVAPGAESVAERVHVRV